MHLHNFEAVVLTDPSRTVTFLGTFALALLLSGPASADIIPASLSIDFRDSAWAGADGQNSYTVGSVTVSAAPSSLILWQDSRDGLGIQGGEIDEIDSYTDEEILMVEIAGSESLSGVWITDLFEAPDGAIGEHGKVILNDDASLTFSFDGNFADQVNGELFVGFGGPIDVWKAEFFVDNSLANINPLDNEFSVAGFAGVVAVPEPASILLLGTALLLLGGMHFGTRRRRSAA